MSRACRQCRAWSITPASIVAAAAILVGATAGPAAADTSTARSAPPALQAALAKLVSDGIPGAMALERQSGSQWTAAAGVADLSTGQPLSPGDAFRIGSITKGFVSTVILQLAEEGRLGLDDTVEHWLPGLVPNGGDITIRELLNQTSGLYDYIDIPFYINLLHQPFESYTPLQLISLATSQPPVAAPGTQWDYSNTNYVLLGLIIAKVDGVPAQQAMPVPAAEIYRRIVAPLGLTSTSFPLDDPSLPPPFAHGYEINAPAELGIPPVLDTTFENPSWAWTAGAMVSRLVDVANFHRALFTGRLLDPAEQRALETTVPTGEAGLRYGLGVFRMRTPCGPAWGHDGGTPSSYVISLTSPDGSLQAVVMLNMDANDLTDQEFTDLVTAYDTAYCGQTPSAAATDAGVATTKMIVDRQL